MKGRKQERKLRRMQGVRVKPQRSIEPRSAAEHRQLNRKFTRNS